ncbi:MAG: hypothetical protein PHE24_05240 [Patescibacteria group bacterium]|nr:hypothetical protein [Patescibacteria group bacterium]
MKTKTFFPVLCSLLLLFLFTSCDISDDGTGTFNVSARHRAQKCKNLKVDIGDTLIFSASGIWDMGLGAVGPDGSGDLCECPVSEYNGRNYFGPIGAVIGRIGSGKYFLIGSGTKIIAENSGHLYLGANDNMGPCQFFRGSCYDDNRGSIPVSVEIRKK